MTNNSNAQQHNFNFFIEATTPSQLNHRNTTVTTMKSPSPTQNTNPLTLRNSLLQAWSRNAAVAPVFPLIPMTTTTSSPKSEADQREQLLVILDAAIALVDKDDFDFDPDETPQSKHGALGWKGPYHGDGDSRA